MSRYQTTHHNKISSYCNYLISPTRIIQISFQIQAKTLAFGTPFLLLENIHFYVS